MTDDERKVLVETAVTVGAILEGLSDGCGRIEFQNLRRIFAQNAGDAIVRLARSRHSAGEDRGG